MKNIIFVFGLLVIIIPGIVVWLQYKKDKSSGNQKITEKLKIKIIICLILVVICEVFIFGWNHFFPEGGGHATKNDLTSIKGDLTSIIERLDELSLPPVEEVKTELEKELKELFEKKEKQAIALYEKGNIAYKNDNYILAAECFENALNIADIPSFYLALGNSCYILGQYEKAFLKYEKALELYKDKGYDKGKAAALGNIGLIYRAKGDLDNALKYLKDALKIHKEIGYRQGEASALGNIGLIYRDKGDLDNALKYLKEAEKIFKEIGSKPQLKIAQEAIELIKKHKK